MGLTIEARDTTFDRGEMIRVPISGRPGSFVRMTRAEAKARGLIPTTKEKKTPVRNKARRRPADSPAVKKASQ